MTTKTSTLRRCAPLAVAALALGLSACGDLNPRQQRALTGTAAGTAGGAIVGAIAGDAALGAVIGAGAGLAGGLIVDKVENDKDAAYRRGVQDGRRRN